MPGIVGVVSRRPEAECARQVAAMTASMMSEPFYEAGNCFAPDLGVYAGWVAHRGSYAARQPAAGSAGVTALLSGECVWDDGEIGIASVYEQFGERAIGRLNGLFSGLVVDHRNKRALLFNDRYGIERIYFHETGDALYFASEAKALLRVLPALRTFDHRNVTQFLAFGCTPAWQTVFRGIGLLEGGSLWTFENGAARKSRYFVPAEWESQPALDAQAFDAEFQQAFARILPRYFDAGSRVAISLTGGLDTRMIMACLPQVAERPVCYTFSGRTEVTLDERLAGRVAAVCGLPHQTLRIGGDFLADYARYVDRTVYATDGCSGATGAHELYLNARAREVSPVRVTGNFGSEVLRSMSTFKPIGLSPALFEPDFGVQVSAAASCPPAAGEHPVTFSAFREIPWSLFGNLAAGRSQVTFRTPYLDNEIVALAFRAPVRSRQSPDAALSLIGRRHPALGGIPTDRGLMPGARGPAHALRRLVSEVTFKLDYLHKEGLPRSLSAADPVIGSLARFGFLGLHKYLPFRHWFRQELAGHVRSVLTDARTSRLPYWNCETLAAMAPDHISGRRNYVREINAVLTLEAIDRLLLRGAAWNAA